MVIKQMLSTRLPGGRLGVRRYIASTRPPFAGLKQPESPPWLLQASMHDTAAASYPRRA